MQRTIILLLLVFLIGRSALYATESAPAPQIGEPAPTFYLKDLQNNDTFLRDFCGPKLRQPWKNKQKYVVVLSFWATWCGPCQREIPVLQEMMKKYENYPVKTFLVNVGEKPEKVGPFVKKKGFQLPVLLDRYSMVSTKKYGVTTLPRLFVIDQMGKIRLVNEGFTDATHLQNSLGKTLDQLLK